MDVSLRGTDFSPPDFDFLPQPVLTGGGTKYDNGLEGYYKTLTPDKRNCLKQLFYGQMKSMGGQRQLYEAMMNDPNKPSPHPSWREVRAWHAAQTVNALTRPANKSSKSLANPVIRSMLAPCARLGFDTVVMQSDAAADRTRMSDQGYKGFLNIVDQATRMSWPNLIKVVGQQSDTLAAAKKMVESVRESYYNDANSNQWPSPKTLCVVDGGSELGNAFRRGFQDLLGPQVEVKWQTVPKEYKCRTNTTCELCAIHASSTGLNFPTISWSPFIFLWWPVVLGVHNGCGLALAAAKGQVHVVPSQTRDDGHVGAR